MANQAMHTVEDALKPVKEDLKTIGETLTGHYFNFKLDAVISLRDYTLSILGNMQAFTGIQDHRRDSPSAMCATKGVIQAMEEDIDLIGTAATLDLDYFLQNKVVESLRKRIADVLHIMTEEVAGVPRGYEWNPTFGRTSAKGITKSHGDWRKYKGEELPNIMRRSSPSTDVDAMAEVSPEDRSFSAEPTTDIDVPRMFCETMVITDAATKILVAGKVTSPAMDRGVEESVQHPARNRDDQISTSQEFSPDQGARPPIASSFDGSQSYLSSHEKLQKAVGPAMTKGNNTNPWKAMETSLDGLHTPIGQQSHDSSAVSSSKDTVMKENSGPEVPTKSFGRDQDGDENMYFSDSGGSCAMDLDSDAESMAPILVLKETSQTPTATDHGRTAGVMQSHSKEARLSAPMASPLEPSKQIIPPSADMLLSQTSNANFNSTVGKTKSTTPSTVRAQRVGKVKSKAPRAVSGRNGSATQHVTSTGFVKWGVSTKKSQIFPDFKNEPFIIFFLEMENAGLDGDDRGQSSHFHVPETLVFENAGALQDLFAEKHQDPGRFDSEDRICWDPEISKALKPYPERSVYIMAFIDYEAEKGNEDAVALQGYPRKIWGLFLHWWRFMREKKAYPVSCPWQKERLLRLARVLDADETYIKKIEKFAVRDKMYEDEEEDMMWATHQHPDWLLLYDQSRYNMLKASGKLWEKRKT